ncbi:hypothetical protein Hanom_Chr01g00054751 [Helianthus anomalus]
MVDWIIWQSDRMTIRSSVLEEHQIGINLTIYCLLDAHYIDNTPFKVIAKILRENKISKALTDRIVMYESHVRKFWSSVRYEEKEKMIYSAVRKKDESGQDVDVEIKFNIGDLRRVLELGDSDDDPTIIPERL